MLSVVIVSCLKYPQQAVDAVLKHTVGQVQVVVVVSLFDGVSPAKLPENVELHAFKERLAAGQAANVGLQYARGEWIATIAGDMVVLPHWNVFPTIALIDNPHFGYVSGCATWWVHDAIPDGPLKGFQKWTGACNNPASIMRTETLRGLGGHSEEYNEGIGFEDDDLYMRFLLAGYTPRLLAVYTHTEATDVPTRMAPIVFGDKLPQAVQRNQYVFTAKFGTVGYMMAPYAPYFVNPVKVNGEVVTPNLLSQQLICELYPPLTNFLAVNRLWIKFAKEEYSL